MKNAKLQMLSIQIQSDVQNLTDDVEAGIINPEEFAEATEKIGEKIRKWGVEALKMIEKIGREREIEKVKDGHIRAEIISN